MRASEAGAASSRRPSVSGAWRSMLRKSGTLQKTLGLCLVAFCILFILFASDLINNIHSHHNRFLTFRDGPKPPSPDPIPTPKEDLGVAAKLQHSSVGLLAALKRTAAPTSQPRSSPTSHWQSISGMNISGLPHLKDFTTPKQRPYVDPSRYLIEPEDRELQMWRGRVAQYIASKEFKDQLQVRKQGPQRGIIINAGGSKLLSSAIILLKVLREELNCTLPVELVWHGAQEMDNATLAGLQQLFGPLEGYDVTSKPYPKHHRKAASLARFEGKVFSLMYSRFQQVLMLDCDLVPLRDPQALFDAPGYVANRNLCWGDAWQNWVSREIYDIVGLKQEVVGILDSGRGITSRDTESGEILLDLVEHADVVEYLCFINSYSDRIYKAIWGDKDTFPLAFALAGKAHLYTQVGVPPGGVFKWRPNMLLTKASQQRSDGWQLMAMLQFDHLGRAAFLHRTINKFWLGSDAWPVELVTGPMPYRWAHYYIAHDSLGPTKGVPWDYVAPNSAFYIMGINPVALRAYPHHNTWHKLHDGSYDGCPAAHFLDYRRMRELGLPVEPVPELDRACDGLLRGVLGEVRYEEYARRGLIEHPQLMGLQRRFSDQNIVVEVKPPADNPEAKWAEVGDDTPLAAWKIDYEAPVYDSVMHRCLRASYAAFKWLQEKGTLDLLPRIRDGP